MSYAPYGMPLLVHATAWWLSGLVAAAWWHTPLPWGLLVAALVVALRTRRAAALLAPVAMLAAWNSATRRERCRQLVLRDLQRDRAVWLAVDEWQPAGGRRIAMARGGLVRAYGGIRCTVAASVQFAVDGPRTVAVRAGGALTLTGNALAVGAGVRVTDARLVRRSNEVRRLVAWRARIGQVIDGAFGHRAALVRALLIADQRGIAPVVRDRYADAGLVHMLSVSGLHVAIIAGALLTVGGAARLPRAWLEPASMVLVAFYILLLGCPPPAVRSGIMLGVVALSARLQRPVHEWTALALGAVVPTADPLVVQDLGWQLSVGGMAALVTARALRRQWSRTARCAPPARSLAVRAWRWLFTRDGATAWLVGELSTGVVATLVTLPVITWTFGRVSLVAPIANIVAGPVVSVLQPALFLGVLWALVMPPSMATWVADATQPIMALLDGIAAAFAAVPGGVLPVAPTFVTACGTAIAAALVVRGSADRRGTPWYLGAAAALVLTLWLPLLSPAPGELELHLLDVGQGDAVALRTPGGHWVLVDAGRRWDGGDAGQRTVVPYVRRRGGEVALFVLSHPHDDHAGGAASVVRALRPAVWWEPAFVTASPGYRAALAAVRRTGARWERVRPGRHVALDGVHVTVLAPDSAWTVAQHDANETSVVVRVQYGATRILLTGDAERDEEAWLLARYPRAALGADVLKLGHHGSRTSSSAALLDAVAPKLALASVGAGNRYGHPAPETLAALLQRGIPVLRTDLEGTVVLRSDGRRIVVRAGADEWIIPAGTGVR